MSLASRLQRVESCIPPPPAPEILTPEKRALYARIAADPQMQTIRVAQRARWAALGVDPEDERAVIDSMSDPECLSLALEQRHRLFAIEKELRCTSSPAS